MNHKSLALTAALAAVLFQFNAQADILTGLIGYWNFSDGPGASNVVDSSGNGNIGTLKNYADATYSNMWTTSTDPMNTWPYALTFTNSLAGFGTNTYVNVPDSPILNTPTANRQWTLSAWVKPSVAGTAEPRFAGIIAKGNQGSEAYALYMNDTAGSGKFSGLFHNVSLGSAEVATSTTVAQPNTWYHVVCVVSEPKQTGSSAEALLYVNGVQQAGANANTFTTVYGTNLPVTIGCRANSSGTINAAFEGTIDEVRIYNRALLPSDVVELYNNKAFPLINDGIGSWNGLAGSGGNATLDTTSLNFCTNLDTAAIGSGDNLPDVLALESANGLQLGCSFGDTYYSSGKPLAVTSTNITIASGGVAVGTASGLGTITFLNSLLTYTLNSSDGIGIKDGANPTSLVQSGNGTVVLTGNNTFSGGVTINSGTVQVGNSGAVTGQELGSATTVADNGTLVFNGNNSLNFSKTISGTGIVTQKGSGALTLSPANFYSGGTTISNSTISAASIGDSGNSSLGTGPVTLSGATLLYTGANDTTSRQFNGIAGTTSTIDVPNGVSLELSGRVTSGAAWTINKNDTGTLIFSGAGDNSFLGMNVNAGTVILNKTGGHAIGNPLTVAAGATVQLSGNGYGSEIFSNTSTPVTINSGGVLDLNGQNNGMTLLNLSGTGIGGGGALINSATGTTSTLICAVALVTNTSFGGIGNIALPGVISSNGSLTYVGTGVLTLSGVNSYTGGTFVNSGTLEAATGASIPGNVTLSGTGVLLLDNAFAMPPVAALTLPAANSVNLNFSGAQTIASLVVGSTPLPPGIYDAVTNNPGGAITGAGLLNVVAPYWDANGTDAASATNINGGGSGSWDNTAADWWVSGNADTTWITNNLAYFGGTAGTVTLNANEGALGLNFLTPGYVITNTDGVSVLTLNGNNPVISIPAGTTAIGCNLGGGGSSVGLTASGPGTLVLSGHNTYSGSTLVTGGTTLSVNTIDDSGTSALGSSSALNLTGGTLSYTGPGNPGASLTVAATASTTNTIDVPAGTLTLGGAVKGTNLFKTGAGTLVLGGSVDNAGLGMNILAGEVIITKASASNVHGLGGAPTEVASGAQLQLAGSGNFDLFNTCVLTVSNGALFDLNGQSDSFSTFTLSGTGIANSGALINSAASTTSAITNGGSGVVLAGATTVSGVGNIALASTVSGAGPITYAGTGTLTLGGNNTYSGGTIINPGGTVALTNSANDAGTGMITVNGTLNLGIVGNNVTLPNTIVGPGIVNIKETANNNLQLGGSMSGFTGVINCPTSPGGTAKAQILTANVALTSAATVNIASGGTLYVANNGVTIPSPININGIGNAEVYGALRIENGALISGPVTLFANTTMGNGQSGANKLATISGPISESNGSFGITFTAEPGTIVLSGTNTYSGATTISGGVLVVGGAGELGSGNYAAPITNNATFTYASSVPQTLSGVISGSGLLTQSGLGTLTLSGADGYTGNTVITNGSLVIGGAGCLGAASGTNYAGNITNDGVLVYASSVPQTLSGVISGGGSLTESGPGTLTLNGANGYTGSTVITNSSTLALTSSGSINTTASINIAAGATFDVSAYGLAYTLGGSTALKASGKGTGVGSTAAAIKGGSGATLNLGSVVLTFTPQTFSGDTTHPALYIPSGALNLSGTGIAINNAAATPLGAGTYSLIQVASGNINAAGTNVTISGAGLAPGATASLGVSGGSLNLIVASSAVPVPVINSVTISGGNLVFSGTNGSDGGTYYVLTSTNVNLPLSQWTPIATNSFGATGNFSVTNNIGGNSQFFIIQTH